MRRYTKPIHLPKPPPSRPPDSSLALINVVFLLLVFLLVSGTLRPPLPDAFEWAETASKTGGGPLQGSFAIDRDGSIWFAGEMIGAEDIVTTVPLAGSGNGTLTVQVDRRAPMAAIAKVTARLEGSGITALSLVTIDAEGP
ncbi:hypothetical protein E1180_21205 [Roseibium denhamense]|uniref:Outer membrane transport energization protein ExbD n=1 Tax=Roseibium denhamense TaxID=76305 RepID=A0ABY1NQD2_9HYPH|nr:biopolymer transporter ExbD [Roseibium denhamense]MTI08022.1 hypothetical protein [Roseibium denhamense]SMP15600.1 outer membrane transport energization protein ExbD [Roseibium denhamense]